MSNEKPKITYTEYPLIDREEEYFQNNNRFALRKYEKQYSNMWHKAGYTLALKDVVKLIDNMKGTPELKALRRKILGERGKNKRRFNGKYI